MSSSSASTVESAGSCAITGSREFRLLCDCATVELSPERSRAIVNAVEGGVDWNEFLRLAEHHGLIPLVARSLGSSSGVPTAIAQLLQSKFETNTRRNLWFLGELIRIVSHCEAQGIKLVPYKGTVLAETTYGDIALRTFGDLDFLIDPADFHRAKRALAGLGYVPSKEFTPAIERFWLRNGYECSFDSAAGKYLVELQWRLSPRFFSVDLETRELLDRSNRISMGKQPVWNLSSEDLILVLCLHAAKHLWMRVIWLCDIAETMRSHTVDYELVLSRAGSAGIARFVLVSFWLSNRLLGRPIPAAARAGVAADPEVEVLGEELLTRLANRAGYDFESTEYFRWAARLRERRRDQFRFLWRLTWTPGVGDLAAVELPEQLFPLYRGVRLLRLIRKLF